MSTQETMQVAKQDSVLKYTLWFIVAAMIFGMLPISIVAIYSGKAINAGLFGLVVCLGTTGVLLSLFRKDD